MKINNLKIIGLTGFAGSGKDTVADILVSDHGFVKFSFSDALYDEVAAAFGVSKRLLQDRVEKEEYQECLSLTNCDDGEFSAMVLRLENSMIDDLAESLIAPRKPRDVLQLWGTEYRRAQDPNYWVARAQEFAAKPFYDSCAGLVNTSVRFDNEADWVSLAGEVWCIRRPGHDAINTHVSEKEQPAAKVIVNDGSIEDLRMRIAEIMA